VGPHRCDASEGHSGWRAALQAARARWLLLSWRLRRKQWPSLTTPLTSRPPPPPAYALGFLDCNDISARCMLTIFQFFATKTDASVLRMLNGSPAGASFRAAAAGALR
jgi:hypothetical protein